jgi:hypothetical protein
MSTAEASLSGLGQTLFHSVKIAAGVLKRRPGHRLLLKAFYDSLRSEKPVPVPAEAGLEMARTLERLARALAGEAE